MPEEPSVEAENCVICPSFLEVTAQDNTNRCQSNPGNDLENVTKFLNFSLIWVLKTQPSSRHELKPKLSVSFQAQRSLEYARDKGDQLHFSLNVFQSSWSPAASKFHLREARNVFRSTSQTPFLRRLWSCHARHDSKFYRLWFELLWVWWCLDRSESNWKFGSKIVLKLKQKAQKAFLSFNQSLLFPLNFL